MKDYPLTPKERQLAVDFKGKIQYEHNADVEFSGSEHDGEAIFVLRTDFKYRLEVIRDEFFEGDGLIIKFHEDTDLRPIFIMVSHKTLIKYHE